LFTVPDVHKAVKWNQPFYGHEGEGWFVTFRCYTNDEVRYLDTHEDNDLDEAHPVSGDRTGKHAARREDVDPRFAARPYR
jgi:hypothetical protein